VNQRDDELADETTLNLGYNNIGADEAKALGAALAQNSSQTTLHLRKNNFGDDGAALAQNSSQTALWVTKASVQRERRRWLIHLSQYHIRICCQLRRHR
jgi:hypothetical protein